MDNFVSCGDSIVVIFYLSPNHLGTYTAVVTDEIYYKVIEGVGEKEWEVRWHKIGQEVTLLKPVIILFCLLFWSFM